MIRAQLCAVVVERILDEPEDDAEHCVADRRLAERSAAAVLTGTGTNPKLMMLVVYAATGGLDFIIQAWLVARRPHQAAVVSAHA